jgi:hypothetical protein
MWRAAGETSSEGETEKMWGERESRGAEGLDDSHGSGETEGVTGWILDLSHPSTEIDYFFGSGLTWLPLRVTDTLALRETSRGPYIVDSYSRTASHVKDISDVF